MRGLTCIARDPIAAGAKWAYGARRRTPKITQGTSAGRWIHALTPLKSIVVAMNRSDPMKESRTKRSKEPCRREYDFALVLDGIAELNDAVMNKLFNAGCVDATFSVRYGRVFAEFSREAESYPQALLSAIRDVKSAGVGAEVLRVNTCDLVTPADIARRIARSRELVSQYISGDRGPGKFPPPECFLADDKPLWMWCAVSYWLAENSLIRPEEYREAQFVWVVNEWLSSRRSRHENPDLISQIEKALNEPTKPGKPIKTRVASTQKRDIQKALDLNQSFQE